MQFHADDDKIKAAAAELHRQDSAHDDDERPSLAVYEQAVARWMEICAENILVEAGYFAYGPNRILNYYAWEQALDWAKHQAQSQVEPVRMCADPDCLNAADMSDSGMFCLQHAVKQYAALADQWDAASILRREG